MEWQIVLTVLNAMLLAVGYFLFQQARGELSAHAAETPVLSEVKALQRSVKQLLIDIESAADKTATRLEDRCAEARALLSTLEQRLQEIEETEQQAETRVRSSRTAAKPASRRKPTQEPEDSEPAKEKIFAQGIAAVTPNYTSESGYMPAPSARDTRRQTVYAMTDAGESPAAIAHATGLSEGEVETLLGVRLQKK